MTSREGYFHAETTHALRHSPMNSYDMTNINYIILEEKWMDIDRSVHVTLSTSVMRM